MAAARRIPNVGSSEIAKAGHLAQVDAFPQYVRALLEFFTGGYVGSLSRPVKCKDNATANRSRQGRTLMSACVRGSTS